tara:strand:- start:1306 stop:2268 length:963 start_codon:yes stop_codon:yes gene_type:complete
MAILGVRGGTDGIPNMIFTTGETWSPNKTVQAYVYVIGAGGSGAGGGGNSDHGFSGGGAGGCAVSLLQLNAGVTYTAVIGAGGAYAGGSSQQAGNAGGDSTFNSSDISIMTGSGGAAGAIASGASAASAAGGSASGGNLMNNTGGASLASGATRQVSGGGAVGLWDTGRQGTTVASSNDWADGGNLSGPPVDAYPTSTRYGDDTFVAGAPFPEIYSVTSSQLRSRSDTVFDVSPSFQPAGVQPYSYLGEDVAWSGNTRAYPAPPFSGGNGYITNQDTYCYGGSASLGGGGGAVLGTGGSSEGFSGKGGMGAVLIFPISMG